MNLLLLIYLQKIRQKERKQHKQDTTFGADTKYAAGYETDEEIKKRQQQEKVKIDAELAAKQQQANAEEASVIINQIRNSIGTEFDVSTIKNPQVKKRVIDYLSGPEYKNLFANYQTEQQAIRKRAEEERIASAQAAEQRAIDEENRRKAEEERTKAALSSMYDDTKQNFDKDKETAEKTAQQLKRAGESPEERAARQKREMEEGQIESKEAKEIREEEERLAEVKRTEEELERKRVEAMMESGRVDIDEKEEPKLVDTEVRQAQDGLYYTYEIYDDGTEVQGAVTDKPASMDDFPSELEWQDKGEDEDEGGEDGESEDDEKEKTQFDQDSYSDLFNWAENILSGIYDERFDYEKYETEQREAIEAAYADEQYKLALRFNITPGGALGGDALAAFEVLAAQHTENLADLQRDIFNKKTDDLDTRLKTVTDVISTAAKSDLDLMRIENQHEQFMDNLTRVLEVQLGIDRDRADAIVKETNNRIKMDIRRDQREFAELYGEGGAGPMSAADLGWTVTAEDRANANLYLRAPYLIEAGSEAEQRINSFKTLFSNQMGREITDTELGILMTGNTIDVENRPTQRAKEAAARIAESQLERINDRAKHAAEIGLRTNEYNLRYTEYNNDWNLRTGTVAEESGLNQDAFTLSMHELGNFITTLYFNESIPEGNREELIQNKLEEVRLKYFPNEEDKAAFFQAAGNHRRAVIELDVQTASNMKISDDEWRRVKRANDLEEQKEEAMWTTILNIDPNTEGVYSPGGSVSAEDEQAALSRMVNKYYATPEQRAAIKNQVFDPIVNLLGEGFKSVSTPEGGRIEASEEVINRARIMLGDEAADMDARELSYYTMGIEPLTPEMANSVNNYIMNNPDLRDEFQRNFNITFGELFNDRNVRETLGIILDHNFSRQSYLQVDNYNLGTERGQDWKRPYSDARATMSDEYWTQGEGWMLVPSISYTDESWIGNLSEEEKTILMNMDMREGDTPGAGERILGTIMRGFTTWASYRAARDQPLNPFDG